MTPDELQVRTKLFAQRVVKLVDALPSSVAGREIGRQLLRSATSVGANFRAARRGRSSREYLAKISIVVEEADESEYWLELIRDCGLLSKRQVGPLLQEATELTKIFASTRRTARANNKSPDRQITKSPNPTSKDES
ncbi:MAG: four helix bundle protein [Phycisphaeraceae bacterium]